jgi:hypothetical protein
LYAEISPRFTCLRGGCDRYRIGCASRVLRSDKRAAQHRFILTDDHRFDAMGFMGHPFVETPHAPIAQQMNRRLF